MADRVNEGSSWFPVVSFFDEDDAPVTPTTARYRIDDVKSGTAIVAATTLTGLGTTKQIEITASQNAIIGPAHLLEPRLLTVDFTYNSTRRGVVEYCYDVVNLRYAPVG